MHVKIVPLVIEKDVKQISTFEGCPSQWILWQSFSFNVRNHQPPLCHPR